MITERIGSEYGYFIHPHAFENLEESRYSEKDIVFFDVMDSYDFFVMKPDSPKPDAIYDIYGCEIEESFEKFIWRLYYDSPTYYLDINKEEYEEEQRQEELRQAEIAKRLQEAPARGVAWEYIRRNYQQLLKDKELHEEFEFDGEPYAEHILREFKDQIESNYCPNCGHLKKTPKARQCLQCGEFHDVKLI